MARLLAVLLVLGSVAATARSMAVPDSFGQFGHYRGDAVADAMAITEPNHQGRTACAECHAAEAKLHAKDMHGKVECESCHGPGAAHVAAARTGGAAAVKAKGSLFVPHTKDPCLWCHRRLASRPTTFPQIDPVEHYKFLAVTDPATPCMKCHNPHEPLFLDKPLAEQRLHPVIQQCRDCHARAPDPAAKRPDDHAVVFECGYCHKEIAADFSTKSHAALSCGKCHLFHRESENAGRLVKNRDGRFCLLCHRAAPFRGEGGPPLVESRDDLGEATEAIHGLTSQLRAAAGGPPAAPASAPAAPAAPAGGHP